MLSDDDLYFDESFMKIPRFSIYRLDTQLLLSKFLRGITPKIYKQELWFLWSACRLMILYIEWTRNDHCQISKKNNSKNVASVMVLVVCTLSDDALYYYEVS